MSECTPDATPAKDMSDPGKSHGWGRSIVKAPLQGDALQGSAYLVPQLLHKSCQGRSLCFICKPKPLPPHDFSDHLPSVSGVLLLWLAHPNLLCMRDDLPQDS